MAGKPKQSISYAGWSVDIFDNDTKIDKLLDAHGWVGFSIYFYLCMKAFGSDGYFYKWCYDLCASTARKMGGGISAGTVQETVGYCLQIGLFDQGLFDGWGVLTSRGIQRSYWAVASKRRVRSVYKELWLLGENESEGLIFVPINEELQQTNNHLQSTNSVLQQTNDTVVYCSVGVVKGREVNTLCPEPEQPASVPPVITIILNTKEEFPFYQTDIDQYSELYPAVDILQEFRKMKGWCLDNPSRRKTKRGIRKFVNSWLARAQDRSGGYRGQSGGQAGNNFNLEDWGND